MKGSYANWAGVLAAAVAVLELALAHPAFAAEDRTGSHWETAAGVGIAGSPNSGLYSESDDFLDHPWFTLEVRESYQIAKHLSLGASVSWVGMGKLGIMYFPPDGDFLSATEQMSMVPLLAHVTVHFPARRTEPYVMVGGGRYLFRARSRPDAPYAPHWNMTRAGVCAALGFTTRSRLSPRLELRYDGRAGSDSDWPLPRWWLNSVTASLGMRFR